MWGFWELIGSWWIYVYIGMLLGGLLGVSFYWWRTMRMDYEAEGIFELTWKVALACSIFGVAGSRLLGTWGFWEGIGVVGGLMIMLYVVKRKSWDAYEWLDVYARGFLLWSVYTAVLWGKEKLMMAGLLAVGFGLSWWVGKNYRRWKWYKSGKTGASGLIALVWWGGVQVAVAFTFGSKIYWGGITVEQWLGVWLLTIAVVTLYLRSDQRLFENYLRNIGKNAKQKRQ